MDRVEARSRALELKFALSDSITRAEKIMGMLDMDGGELLYRLDTVSKDIIEAVDKAAEGHKRRLRRRVDEYAERQWRD